MLVRLTEANAFNYLDELSELARAPGSGATAGEVKSGSGFGLKDALEVVAQSRGQRCADRLALEHMRIGGRRQRVAPGLAVAIGELARAGELRRWLGNGVAGIGYPVAGIGAELGDEHWPRRCLGVAAVDSGK